MKYCGECGSAMDDATKFCTKCGAKLEHASADTKENQAMPAENHTAADEEQVRNIENYAEPAGINGQTSEETSHRGYQDRFEERFEELPYQNERAQNMNLYQNTDCCQNTDPYQNMGQYQEGNAYQSNSQYQPQRQDAPFSGLALTSMILGIVGIFLDAFLLFIPSVLAIIFAVVGLVQAKNGYRGKGFAIAGLVLGIIFLFFYIVITVVVLGILAGSSSTELYSLYNMLS